MTAASHLATKEGDFQSFDLNYRQRAAWRLLPDLDRQFLLDIKDPRARAKGLRYLDLVSRGVDGRKKWLNGLDQLKHLQEDQKWFMSLIRDRRLEDLDDLVSLVMDFDEGHLNSTQYVDPGLWNFLVVGVRHYHQAGLSGIDYPGLVDYLGQQPVNH